ncbi:unnamed protein product, partial [Trichogramma brassicae]
MKMMKLALFWVQQSLCTLNSAAHSCSSTSRFTKIKLCHYIIHNNKNKTQTNHPLPHARKRPLDNKSLFRSTHENRRSRSSLLFGQLCRPAGHYRSVHICMYRGGTIIHTQRERPREDVILDEDLETIPLSFRDDIADALPPPPPPPPQPPPPSPLLQLLMCIEHLECIRDAISGSEIISRGPFASYTHATMYREQEISLSVERLINPVGAARRPRCTAPFMTTPIYTCDMYNTVYAKAALGWIHPLDRIMYIERLYYDISWSPKLTGRLSAHWRGWFREPVVLLVVVVVVALERYSISLEAYIKTSTSSDYDIIEC